MRYKIVITEHADKQLDNILSYIVYRLKNHQAAEAVLIDVEQAYRILEENAESFAICEDPYLSSKEYRKISLQKHNYVIIYQVHEGVVYINGIFHMLEAYREKL